MRVVSQYVEEHGEQILAPYREAARLRRAAGNPPLAGSTRRVKFELVGAPVKLTEASALFTTETGGTRLKVAVFRNGGFDFVEEGDDLDAFSEEDRDEERLLTLAIAELLGC